MRFGVLFFLILLPTNLLAQAAVTPPLPAPTPAAQATPVAKPRAFAPLLPLDSLKINRTQFIEAMAGHGIGVGIHYPAIHLFSAYRELGYHAGQFPNAERIGREIVTLPLFPGMELSDVDRVVEAANQVIAGARR